MAIIYTYPQKSQPVSADSLLITDSEDNNATKTVTIADIRDATVSGVESLIAGDNITLDPAGGTGNVTVSTTGEAEKIVEVVYNNTGNTINKGQPLHITGVNGTIPTVNIADASDPTLMPVSGLANEDIPTMSSGEMIVSGILEGIDTSGIDGSPAEAVIIYVNDSPGISSSIDYLTTNAPTGESNQIQNIGIIVKDSPGTSGSLQVTAIGRSNATPNLDRGSIFIGDGSNQSSTLAIGANTHVLTSDGTTASWAAIPTQPVEDLATTLVAGNDTGGNNINVTGTDQIVLNTNTLQLNTAGDANNTLSSNGTDTFFTANRSLVVSTAGGARTSLTIGSSTPVAQIDVRDLTSSDRFRVNPTDNEIQYADGGTIGATLVFPTNTSSQTYTLPTDQTGTIPVGPAWNSLISTVAPLGGQDGYVITWNDASNEYQLLAAGSGSGIYGGSGSLITDTIVTCANFDLSVNEVSTVRPSIFNVVKGTIPPVKSQDTVAEYLWNGAASGSADARVINIVNGISSGASSTTGLNSTVSGLTGPKTAIKAAVVNSGPAIVGADIGLSVNIDNRAINPSEATTYGVYSSVLNNQATTTIAGYFSSLGFGGSTGYAIITNDGQSGFGTSAPDPSAIVDIESNTQGFKVPTIGGVGAVSPTPTAASAGLIIFDTNTNQFQGWNGTSWVILG